MESAPGLLGRPYLDPRRQALVALAGGLLAAGAPTTDPGGGQRLLGQAVAGSLDAYNRAHANARRQRLLGGDLAARAGASDTANPAYGIGPEPGRPPATSYKPTAGRAGDTRPARSGPTIGGKPIGGFSAEELRALGEDRPRLLMLTPGQLEALDRRWRQTVGGDG